MQALSSERSAQSGQAHSCIRPLDSGVSFAAGPVWRCEDRVRIDYASLDALRSSTGFPDPVSMTVCPYLSSDLLTFLPALFARLPLRRPAPAPGRLAFRHQCPGDTRHPVGQPPPQPAYEVCAPASGLAMNPAARRAGSPAHHRHRAYDQQPPHVALAHLRYPAQPRLAARGVGVVEKVLVL